MGERFPRQRKVLAESLGVTVAALSQWEHGLSKPSFDNLVALAGKLDVSLDMLVFDKSPSSASADTGVLTVHLEQALLKLNNRTSQVEDLLLRTARRLADQVYDTVQDVVAEEHSEIGKSTGALTFDEIMIVESNAEAISIATTDLGLDVIELTVRETSNSPAAGALTHVIAENLLRGRRYRYLVPQDKDAAESVNALLAVVGVMCRGTEINNLLEFRVTDQPFGIPGYVLYGELDINALQRDYMDIYRRITQYLDNDTICISIPSNRDFLFYPLSPSQFVDTARSRFEHFWDRSTAISD